MSEKCPKCDAMPRRDAVLPGAMSIQRFLCGSTLEDVDGVEEFNQGPLCAYNELLSLRRETAALRTELAAAKQRVAELEGNVPLPDTAIPVTPAHAKADAAALDKLRSLHGAPNSNFTPLDRITHIPGKEDHDGEMH